MRRTRAAKGKPDSKNPLAVRIGERLRRSRVAVGMTQQQLAGERYTKAYVSALENALVRPSMVALDYLARRLGTTASALMADTEPRWTRLEADLLLTSGKWQSATDAYRSLLETATDRATRAGLLLGLAEALARMDHGSEAVSAASESADLFGSLGREAEAALAGYWLSAAHFYQDNVTEAKAILQAILGKVRSGLAVEPDFKLRLLMAMSSNEAREGNHEQALGYLDEVRAMAETLDDRRRAAFLLDLATNYSETGDYEAAIKAGYASLALYAAAEMPIEVAKLENELALVHLRIGNVGRASELITRSRANFEKLDNNRQLAHVLDTEAQILLAADAAEAALELAERARGLADETGNNLAVADALLTIARAYVALADQPAARAAFEQAANVARSLRRAGVIKQVVIKQVLTEWAEFLAAAGEHEAAFSLMREAALETKRKRQAFHGSVQDVVSQVAPVAHFETAFWQASGEPCLQIADYCCWAMQRKWERGDDRWYQMIRRKVRSDYDLWSGGTTTYY